MEGMKYEVLVSRAFQYDITRHLQALGLTDTRDLIVTFEAILGLAPSAKKAGRTEEPAKLEVASFRAGAGITIGEVQVR